MIRILKVSVVIALVAVLVAGLTTNVGCDTNDNPNGNSNGNVSNGNEPDGPDLSSGFGCIIESGDATASNLQAGDPAPDFTFQDAAGTTFSLSDFQGKMVMLNFWTTRCGWCVVEMPFMQQVYDEWPDEDLVILTIDIGESAETVATFLQDNGISLPVLLDIEAEVAAQYRITSIPRTFFIGKEGLIQAIKFGALQSKEELEDILDQLVNL